MENRLLAALPPSESDRIIAYMEFVSLDFKQLLYERNQPIEYVYFVTHGVGSMLTVMENGMAVEVATVGNEGMVGLPVFLGADSIPGECFVQVPGDGWRMRVDLFRAHVTPGSPLHELLQRYTQALFNQIAQSAACNRLHSIEERLCRWLLMTADRVEANSFPLTQEFLSLMLGVNRSSVSLTASILQRAGLISYIRGQVTILDRSSLEATSCECYRIVQQEFERLFNGK